MGTRQSSEMCRSKLKQWLLAGLEIADDSDLSKYAHLFIRRPASFPRRPEAEVDAETEREMRNRGLA